MEYGSRHNCVCFCVDDELLGEYGFMWAATVVLLALFFVVLFGVPIYTLCYTDEWLVTNITNKKKGVHRDGDKEWWDAIAPLPCFRWDNEEPKKYRPYKPGIYKSSLSLGKSSIQDWIEIDKDYLELSHLRGKWFDEVTKEVSYCNKNYEFALKKFYDDVVKYLITKYPNCFYEDDKWIYNSIRKEHIPLSSNSFKKSTDILRTLAVTINEDFLILLKKKGNHKTDNNFYLRSCNVCFASGFVPTTMINKSLDTIHGPVPEYAERMKFAMNKFFNRIQPGEYHTRVNWFVMDFMNLINLGDSRYYEPFWGLEEDSPFNAETGEWDYDKVDYDKVFIRSEKQVLTKINLEKSTLEQDGDTSSANEPTEMVVMVVKTYKYPLSEIRGEEESRLRLIEAIEGIQGQYAGYKGKPEWVDLLMPFLSSPKR